MPRSRAMSLSSLAPCRSTEVSHIETPLHDYRNAPRRKRSRGTSASTPVPGHGGAVVRQVNLVPVAIEDWVAARRVEISHVGDPDVVLDVRCGYRQVLNSGKALVVFQGAVDCSAVALRR